MEKALKNRLAAEDPAERRVRSDALNEPAVAAWRAAAAPLSPRQRQVACELADTGFARIHLTDLLGDEARWQTLTSAADAWLASDDVRARERSYREAERHKGKDYLIRRYGRGAEVVGATEGDPKSFQGTGIRASGVSNVTLVDVRVRGWETGLLVENGSGWTIEDCDFSDNFHDPSFGWGENGLRGGGHETIFFVGGPDEAIWKEVGRLSKTLEAVQTGPLVFHSKNNLPFGQGWNTQANMGNRKAFSRWAAALPGVETATTIEVAYANADGKTVTDQTARALGHDLVRAFRKHLAE